MPSNWQRNVLSDEFGSSSKLNFVKKRNLPIDYDRFPGVLYNRDYESPHIPPEQHPPLDGGVGSLLDPVRAIPLNTCENFFDPHLSHFKDDTISCFLSKEERNSITSSQSVHLYSYKGIFVFIFF
jgi:hypothetical protein